MSFLKKHLEYLRDNPEGYWFKSKLYGWGWVPVTREGWLVILFFVLFLGWSGWVLEQTGDPSSEELFWFFARLIAAIVILLTICYKKGERPRWQWGPPKKKS